MPRSGHRSWLALRGRPRQLGALLGAVVAGQFGGITRLGTRWREVVLDADAHARQISQETRVVEVVAFARRDGGMRGAVRDGALQGIKLAQRGDQFLALCRRFGQRHWGLPHQEGRQEKSGHAAMRGA
ncbi:hypothetical protein XAC3810_340023 [Xanthomonas citri pv. citri]|nr:hypothetical protein XAC3810_340023 [Xanthomonas citri pv. citri]CEE61534.1 hypothetical protein XAC3608_1940023 [Xanthomonas citri pv. citri]CEE78663.1 hypothetical protein XACLE20_1700005 [Xanthomonas citri pv. citri]CEH49923.1 hypothetical protein XACLD7_14240005 [Xanthomonas citri pv. citri]CEH59531.1 hypothetical protein XACJK48_9080022 [Xanthomonas citri pv. citri]